MILYANGCSMTYGSELFKEGGDQPLADEARGRAAWPGRLGSIIGAAAVHNDALPSGSNDRVLRTSTEWLLDAIGSGTEPTELVVVIGWSAPMRREFTVDGSWRQVIPYHDYRDADLNELNRVYREIAWDDTESAQRFALQAVSLQSLLRDRLGVRYLFFDALRASAELAAAEIGSPATVAAIDPAHYHGFREEHGDLVATLRATAPNEIHVHPTAAGHCRWAATLATALEQQYGIGPASAPTQPVITGAVAPALLDVKVGRSPAPPARHGRPAAASWRVMDRIKQAFEREPFIYD